MTDVPPNAADFRTGALIGPDSIGDGALNHVASGPNRAILPDPCHARWRHNCLRGPARHLVHHRLREPLRLQTCGRLPVPDSGDEVDAVEGAALGDALGQLARKPYAGGPVVLDRGDP